MGIYKVVLPKMGESVSEATITKWLKEIGERVQEDESIIEIATDKVDSDVPSPVGGILKEMAFQEGDTVQVGEVFAVLEVEGDGEEKIDNETPEDIEISSIPGTSSLESRQVGSSANKALGKFYSPLVKSIAQQEGITAEELDKIPGSGMEGRLTKQDLMDFIKSDRKSNIQAKPETSIIKEQSEVRQPAQKPKSIASAFIGEGDEIIEMDRMRRLIADHMVHSASTSPHVASFVEADVTNLVNWRNSVKAGFKQKERENITFTPIFIEAISRAIRDFPMINVSVDGYNIIRRKNINIGMAAALPSGNLIVPVIKNADQLSLVGLTRSVNDLANRARSNELKPDDTQGGTFTFTNIGAFGNIMGVPIINQPQAAILAVGTIKKKPAVIETADGDAIAIRHMMYLSLSYDHRVIDGALGGTFLKRVADYLEEWDTKREI